MTRIKAGSAAIYIASIILGNIFVALFGIGVLQLSSATTGQDFFRLTFPLGAMWIGLTFSFRDFVQRYWGHQWTWLWIFLASLVTWAFNRDLAYASVLSFAAAESTDWLVFYVLRRRSLKCRLVVSNIFSCPVDSVIFVTIAFGVPWYDQAVWGQALVKYICGLFALPLVDIIEGLYNRLLPSNFSGSFATGKKPRIRKNKG